MLVTINLRDYYPWYVTDDFVEVSEDVAAELQADRRYEKTHERNNRRHKVYSLNAEDGIEKSAFACHSNNPEALFAMIENHCKLCYALNSLPESQGRRIDAHYLQGVCQRDIARAEGVNERNVRLSISKGLSNMRNFINNHR